MGFLDKAKGVIQGREHQVHQVIDKAASAIDKKTGGKHAGTIGSVAGKAKEAVDKLDTADGQKRSA